MGKDSSVALDLVDQILAGNWNSLSEEDRSCLQEHKEVCVRKFLPILAWEISQLQEEESWTPTRVEGCMRLAGFYKEHRAFSWICQIHPYESEILTGFSPFFRNDLWAGVLVETVDSQWRRLKEDIENPSIGQFVRAQCLVALGILVALGRVDREEVVLCYRDLYAKVISGEFKGIASAQDLILCSADIWIGDFEEEIRECYGLALIPGDSFSLDLVLAGVQISKEEILADTRQEYEEITTQYFLKEFAEEYPVEEEGIIVVEVSIQELDGQTREVFSLKRGMVPSESFEKISKKDVQEYILMTQLVKENPSKGLSLALKLFENYPHVVGVHEALRICYMELGMMQESFEILQNMIEQFPESFIAKMAYADYLLGRGEPDRVEELFCGEVTLSGIVPERKIFSIMEWVLFCYTIGWFFAQKQCFEDAQYYLSILQEYVPESLECEDLQEKIHEQMSLICFDEDDFNE